MSKPDDIKEELQNAGSQLADVSRTMPYAVPGNYFELFDAELMKTINDLAQHEEVPGFDKALPYRVPDGYFEQLTSEVVAAAIVTGLPKNMPYAIKEGYFDMLPQQVSDKIKAEVTIERQAKVIPLKHSKTSRLIKWAAAAAIVMGIGIGSYKVYTGKQEANADKILASVPNNEIQDYLQHTCRLDIDRIFDHSNVNNIQIDNKDIIQYLNETGWDVID